jgi:hypothetical protein
MTIYGWDMSHFDAPGVGTAVADGISFITHKAGGDKLDDELGAWWSGVRGLDPGRVLLGAYWVLYPGNPAGRADAFIARLDDACPGWRNRPWILQADCEKWSGDASTVPSRSDIKAFCDRLRARMPKLRPIVYAPKWVYGGSLAGLGYPLWASSYVTGSGGFKSLYPGDGSSKWASYSGQTPAILQYSSSATIGGQSTSDANAYRGTLAELTALVAPGWEDDVTKQDVFDALAEYFAVGKQPKEKGGLPESKIGHDASAQGVPDTINGGTTTLYQLIGSIGALTKGIAAKLDVPVSEVLAAVGGVDEQVLAALTDAGRSDEEVAAALRATLGDRAAAVGALLAS